MITRGWDSAMKQFPFRSGPFFDRKFVVLFCFYKSCNLFKFVWVLLSALVERVGVSRMRDFLCLALIHRVAMSVCLSVCPLLMLFFFRSLIALRSHDQFKASDWSTLLHYHTYFLNFYKFWGHKNYIWCWNCVCTK